MGAAIGLRADYDGEALRRLAKVSRDAKQTRRLLALAAIYDGGSRSEAAKLGGVDLQIVRDWVVRFNAEGPEGLGRVEQHPGVVKESMDQLAPVPRQPVARSVHAGADRGDQGLDIGEVLRARGLRFRTSEPDREGGSEKRHRYGGVRMLAGSDHCFARSVGLGPWSHAQCRAPTLPVGREIHRLATGSLAVVSGGGNWPDIGP